MDSLAYKIFQERDHEHKLVADYEKHLASLQGDGAANADLLNRQWVESIVNKLSEDREKKQWRVSLLGRDVKIREQAERLVKFLLWSEPIVKTAVSTQPYAALAWSGASLLLPLLTSGTTQNEAMLKGFKSIGDIQVYWHICEETYLRPPHRQQYQGLTEPLAKVYSHVIEYQVRVICHLSRAQLSRAWHTVTGWDDWAGKAGHIDELSKRCRDCINPLEEQEIRERWSQGIQEMQESRTILDQIRQIVEQVGRQTQQIYEDQRERELLGDLASDYEGYKNFDDQSRVPGTCEWFFNDDRFRKWRDSNTSSLLWVSAGPGCGKTVLSRALVDEHRLSTNVTTSTVCHFFFKDGDERRMYSTNALCAILHQLLTRDPSGKLIRHALPRHKNYNKSLANNFFELWRILVECARSPDTGEIICILDALDECDESSGKQFIHELRKLYCEADQLSHSSLKLKFLITSRPYDNLEASFGTFSGTTTYLRFDGDDKSDQISREINLVIDARVQDIATGFTAEDQQKISERLKSMEHPTYLWLYLTFDIIKKSPSQYGRLSDVEELLSNLPPGVSDAYEKILSRSPDRRRTEILLQIMLAAARPLTLDEASVALTLALSEQIASHAALESKLWPRDNFESVVKNLCGLFVNVYGSKLSFIHQTAREFLTAAPEPNMKWKGCFNLPGSHSTISRCCLDYLLLPDLPTQARDDSTNDKKYPFIKYAAAYWPSHYVSQEAADADRHRKDARTLCNVAGRQASIWAPSYFRRRYYRWEGGTDLGLASYLGLKPVVKDILLEEKIDVDVQGEDGTALQIAVGCGHSDIVRMLLDKGAV
ncbi:hypothetical protein DL762_006888 [Monosporascus cannonballus]|uniref:NWD NACHT-NTPase N-terminal domain-containing protein n=1 Tax=Monosporascus cannonballus TaxID=155416 RepID=A0ABY0H4A6_9PEZI|nr:hypothetical protein DL762_006888 [Monosporascus cannonballus]